MTEPQPYELGRLAYELDLPLSENPYRKYLDDVILSEHFYSWRKGWFEAQDCNLESPWDERAPDFD
jgi:hypothetical protein